MKPGDLVKWTFAKTSDSINRNNEYYIGLLLYPAIRPIDSWIIMLCKDGSEVHADITEIEVISENR